MSLELKGVNQGPFGSLVREKYGIDNSNPDALFSEEGQKALTWALSQYRNTGATIGGAPTFRLTDFRVSDEEDWRYNDSASFHLSDQTKDRNIIAAKIARAVYGNNMPVVGLLAPISDTSGGHDKEWAGLGDNQTAWAIQRQFPQMRVLKGANIDIFWCEAFRYVNEAIAVATLARTLSARALVVNFEVNENGIPDPAFRGRKFIDTKMELQRKAGDNVEVLVGANCTGISNIRKIWELGDRVDVAYPNELDLSPDTKLELSRLIESPEDTEDPKTAIQRIINDHRTRFEDVVQFWKDAVQNGVKIMGGCCGTTPEHTWVARKVYDEAM